MVIGEAFSSKGLMSIFSHGFFLEQTLRYTITKKKNWYNW